MEGRRGTESRLETAKRSSCTLTQKITKIDGEIIAVHRIRMSKVGRQQKVPSKEQLMAVQISCYKEEFLGVSRVVL